MWQLTVGISKVSKYASRDSGDTVEVVERPGGGLSVVVADAQGTGTAAKTLSNLVTSRAVGLLKDGVRDTAVHEAVHDFLFSYKSGRVSCTLTTLSAIPKQRIYTVTRNSVTPVYTVRDCHVTCTDDPSSPIGIVADLTPQSWALPMEPGLQLVAFTDGIHGAGSRSGARVSVQAILEAHCKAGGDPRALADTLLERAQAADNGRPVDDMSVAVIGIRAVSLVDERRTMTVKMPLRPDMVVAREEQDE